MLCHAHQALAHANESAGTNIEIAREIALRARLNEIHVKHTSQTLELEVDFLCGRGAGAGLCRRDPSLP